MSILFLLVFIVLNVFGQFYFRTFDSRSIYESVASKVLIEEIIRVILIFLILKINPKILLKFALLIIIYEYGFYIYNDINSNAFKLHEALIILITLPFHIIATAIYNEKIKLNLLKFILIYFIHCCINISAYFYFKIGNMAFMYLYTALGILCTIASVKYIYFNRSAKDAPI